MYMKNYYLLLVFLCFSIGANAQNQNKSIKTADLNEIQTTLSKQLKKGFLESDLDSWVIQSDASSRNKQSWYYYVAQTHNDIIVRSTTAVMLKTNDSYQVMNSRFIQDLESKINIQSPTLSPELAVLKALSHYKLKADFSLKQMSNDKDVITFQKTADLQSDIKVDLVYEPTKEGDVKLAWNINLDFKDGSHWWNVRIDAASGDFINDNDWVVSCNGSNENVHNHKHSLSKKKEMDFMASVKREEGSRMMTTNTYRALPYYVESPNHGDFQLITNPDDATASPSGWHDDGVSTYTSTRGNNVVARDDQDGDNNTLGPITGESSAGLVFDYPYGGPGVAASSYLDAASAQIFYMSNVVHDVYYKYGFDEASGNFQRTNFSGAAGGGDPVNADIQDGSGFNNANFSTPGDGFSGRMQMFLWNQGAYDPNAVPILVVNNSPVAGDYNATNNAFDPGNITITAPLTGDLALANDGTPDTSDACTDIANGSALNGKIAVIRRGDCTFVSKVLKAQAVGAIGVLIINNEPGLAGMSGADASITIPAYILTQTDGESIIAAMATETVNITLNPPTTPPTFVNIDGDFDNGVVAHEYGHGINTRLVGGRNDSSCVRASESPGEGWADFIGKILLLKNIDNGVALGSGVGTFVVGQSPNGTGIRPAPYSGSLENNPMTYQALIDDTTNATYTIPHGVGSVWAGMLWDVTWDLIAVHGFTDDIYDADGGFGNTIALNLVVEGMKLTPCSPGFVEARDAILQADQALYGGANTCIIWSAFARRGLGVNASQGVDTPRSSSSDSTSDGNADFTLPTGLGCNPDFLIENGDNSSINICQGTTSATYDFVFYEQNGFDVDTPFAAIGLPTGATATFSPTTMKDTGIFTMTVSGISLTEAGSFPITVIPGGDATKGKTVDLLVNTSNPNLIDGDTLFSINAATETSFSNTGTIAVESTDNLVITIPSNVYQGTVLWTAPNGTTYTTDTIGFTNVTDNDTAVEGNWTAQFSFTNDCGNTLAPQVLNFVVDVDGILGVEDFSINQITLFPNPTKSSITITGLQSMQDVKISVIDIMGRVLSNDVSINAESKNRMTVNMSQLSSGTYFIEIKSNDSRTIKKVIKN